MMKRFTVLAFLSFCSASLAATYHVTPNGAGNQGGQDWLNAMNWASFVPIAGNVYYLAGTSGYGARQFNTGGSNGNWVTLRKATTSDHGSSAGWNASWGTNAATFNGGISLQAVGWWEIDGVTGGGPGSWTNGHGIVISCTAKVLNNRPITIWGEPGLTHHYKFQHLKLLGDGGEGEGIEYHNDLMQFREDGSYGDNPHDIYIGSCWFEDSGACHISGGGSNVLIEKNYFGRYESTEAEHAASVLWYVGSDLNCGDFGVRPMNMTNRWNWYNYATGTAILETGVDGLYVYGNLFNWPYATPHTDTYNGVIGTVGRLFLRNTYVYNNTFLRYNTRAPVGVFGKCNVQNNQFINNVVYGEEVGNTSANCSPFTYNTFFRCTGVLPGTGNVDDPADYYPVNADFGLKTNITGTATIDPRYRTDWWGRVGTSRGALQFDTGTGSPPNITSNNSTGTVGVPFAYSIVADQFPTSYGAQNLPDGLSVNPGNGFITGTPNRVQTNTVILTATNVNGWDTQAVIFTIVASSPQFSVTPSVPLDFWFCPTQSVRDLSFTVSNSGPLVTVLTGYVNGAASPFSLPGTTTFNLSNTQTASITVRYNPTNVAVHSNSVTLRDASGNPYASVGTVGRAYPVASSTNWYMTNSLIVGTMATDGAQGSIYQIGGEATDLDQAGIAAFGWKVGSNTSARIWAVYNSTNLQGDSMFISVNTRASDQFDIWDFRPWRTNFIGLGYVHLRGNGSVEETNPQDTGPWLMQFPSNSFTWTNGINTVLVYGREANPAPLLKSLTLDIGSIGSPPVGTNLLSVLRTTTNTVAVSWPSSSTGLTLQQNTNSASSVNWSNVNETIQDNGASKTFIINPPTGNRFYRLWKP